MTRHILTLSCRDRPGIVHTVASALLAIEANIVESAQFSDDETRLFFMRTAFDSPIGNADAIRTTIVAATAGLTPTLDVRQEANRCRTLILVSKLDHCLLDLLYRWRAGDLPIDVVGVASNHETCRPIAQQYGVPFEFIPVTEEVGWFQYNTASFTGWPSPSARRSRRLSRSARSMRCPRPVRCR